MIFYGEVSDEFSTNISEKNSCCWLMLTVIGGVNRPVEDSRLQHRYFLQFVDNFMAYWHIKNVAQNMQLMALLRPF